MARRLLQNLVREGAQFGLQTIERKNIQAQQDAALEAEAETQRIRNEYNQALTQEARARAAAMAREREDTASNEQAEEAALQERLAHVMQLNPKYSPETARAVASSDRLYESVVGEAIKPPEAPKPPTTSERTAQSRERRQQQEFENEQLVGEVQRLAEGYIGTFPDQDDELVTTLIENKRNAGELGDISREEIRAIVSARRREIDRAEADRARVEAQTRASDRSNQDEEFSTLDRAQNLVSGDSSAQPAPSPQPVGAAPSRQPTTPGPDVVTAPPAVTSEVPEVTPEQVFTDPEAGMRLLDSATAELSRRQPPLTEEEFEMELRQIMVESGLLLPGAIGATSGR